MLKGLDVLYEARWRGDVFIVDDNFIGNKKNVKRFLPELAAWSRERDYPFLFMTEARFSRFVSEFIWQSPALIPLNALKASGIYETA